MAAIKDFVLHSKTPFKSYKEKPEWNGKSFIEVVFQCIRDEIKYKGERPWLVDTTTGETLSIGQVEVEALKAAEVLRASGLGKGDVLHVVVPNSIKFHVTVFGAWLLGAAASVADPSLNEDILKTQLDETKAKVVVCNAESLQKVSRAARNAAVVVRVEDYDAASPTEVADNYIKSLINANNEDTMVIFWSSGTTGRPKGIAHTNNFLFNVLKKSAFPPSTLLQSTCFFHTGGFFAPIDGGLYNGFIIAFMDPNKAISMQDIVGAVNKFRPNVIVCGSHHAVQMSGMEVPKHVDLSSVQIVAPMGAAVHLTIVDDLKARFPSMMPAILGYYGMSEVGTICNSMLPDCLGALAPGCQAKILDDNRKVLGPKQVGEILVKTPTIMKAYLNQEEESAQFFDDPDGFVHTGDLGYYDENGVLFYHGRQKELIKYQNCHIYPAEIEDAALTHPDIIEIGVYGRPDPKVQELVSAVVIKRPNSGLTEMDVINHVNGRLDSFKHIRGGVQFVSIIPRNPQGKIIRSKLK